MADQQILSISAKTHQLTVGVSKFDYKTFGYADVFRIASELSKDKNYLEILVRKVSQDNWGIQFIIAIPKEEIPEGINMFSYISDTYRPLFKGTYALDLAIADPGRDDFNANWIVQQPFVLNRD